MGFVVTNHPQLRIKDSIFAGVDRVEWPYYYRHVRPSVHLRNGSIRRPQEINEHNAIFNYGISYEEEKSQRA